MPEQRPSRRRWQRLGWGLGGVGLATGLCALALRAWVQRDHDPTDPRSAPNAFRMAHTVTVARAPETVYAYIRDALPRHYGELARAHERFEFTVGDALTVGARYVTHEFIGDDGVLNDYRVERADARGFAFRSPESRIVRRSGDTLKSLGTCSTRAFFDLEPEGTTTRLTQTVVIEFPNFAMKLAAGLLAPPPEKDPWKAHLVEELEGLKRLIERSTPPPAAGATAPATFPGAGDLAPEPPSQAPSTPSQKPPANGAPEPHTREQRAG